MQNVTSDSIGNLAGALAKFQGKAPNIAKSNTAKIASQKGSYSYTYADLGTILEKIREPLSEAGLAIFQSPMTTDAGHVLVSRVIHAESGEWAQSIVHLPVPNGADAKALGSAITYARRYALISLLGLATEDDDGDAASVAQSRARNRPAANGAARRPAAKQQAAGDDLPPFEPNPRRARAANGATLSAAEAEALTEELKSAGLARPLSFAAATLKRGLGSLTEISHEDAETLRAAMAQAN